MFDCHIQDKRVNILYRGLRHTSDIAINQLWLTSNGLTAQSSSMISEITINCKVKDLGISSNYTIGENQQLYSMLSDPTNVLEQLIYELYPFIIHSSNQSLHSTKQQSLTKGAPH